MVYEHEHYNPFEPSREAALVTDAGNGIKAALPMLVKERNVPLMGCFDSKQIEASINVI
jgi:hypothetical protein